MEIGEEIEVTIAPDTAERTVEVPPALAEALTSARRPGGGASLDGPNAWRTAATGRGAHIL